MPGESYVQIDAQSSLSVARVGPTSTYVSFASGCAGTLPATRLVPRDTPRIGETLEVTLFDLPMHAAFLMCSWNRLQSPLGLDPVGVPGCSLQIDPQYYVFLAGSNQQAKHRLAIPNYTGLVGLHLFSQAVVLDPAANALGVVMSDAAEAVIGNW
jgi:hypothetical protein